MATSLVSTGLQFPDSTIQTTAATAGGGSIEAVASGSLANGDLVVINTDGTVSVVAETAISQSLGTEATFKSGESRDIAITYDSGNNKILICFRDGTNSDYGTAVVGTVSGTSISFGTPTVYRSTACTYQGVAYDPVSGNSMVVYRDGTNTYGAAQMLEISGTSVTSYSTYTFNSASTTLKAITYDSANNKFVIAFQDGGNASYGTAIVATTANGQDITYGSKVVFNSATTLISGMAYDSTNAKVVIPYRDGSNLYGTAIVGTVSGTSISFGTAAVYNPYDSRNAIATYDVNAQKIVIAYSDNNLSNNGYAVVGTVSGTSISFGNPINFINAPMASSGAGISYDSAAKKVTISFRDDSNGYGKLVTGTVSGTSISFGSVVTFRSTPVDYVCNTYDSGNSTVVTAFRDVNADYGKGIVFQNAYNQTNLTSENYIGISNGAYSDAATATIQVAGAVDDAQTGLTPGQSYYVQGDGTLSTTPGDPSVFAGTAVASTKIIVKG